MKLHKGHYGKYTGNSKFSKDHAHTRVTAGNYKASERDDAAHIDYLKRDVLYDEKHGHSDEKMTADEKHISKLAGDMKYDKEHHSPFHDNHPGKIVGENTGEIKVDKKGRTYALIMENSANARKGDTIRPAKGYFNPNKIVDGYLMGGDYKTKKTGPKTRTIVNMNKPSGINHKPMSGRAHIHNKGSVSYEGDATFDKAKKKGGKVIPAGKAYESRDAYLADSTRNDKHK